MGHETAAEEGLPYIISRCPPKRRIGQLSLVLTEEQFANSRRGTRIRQMSRPFYATHEGGGNPNAFHGATSFIEVVAVTAGTGSFLKRPIRSPQRRRGDTAGITEAALFRNRHASFVCIVLHTCRNENERQQSRRGPNPILALSQNL